MSLNFAGRVTLSLIALAGVPIARAADCAALAHLKLPHTTITLAESTPAGTFTPTGEKPIDNLPAFCRVAATIDPSGDSAIRVEVWLPVSGWNQRLEGTGNGGLAGNISYGALAGGLRNGYAVTNTNMGTHAEPGREVAAFGPERWKDWGFRSTHEMTVFAKAIVKQFYGSPEKKDYFVGCSTGGEQALMEAQRFPDDYDGIVGGAPAHNRTRLHESILWNFAAVEADPASYLPAPRIELLRSAVLEACDAADGAKDGVIADPTQCKFDPATLACKGADSPACLTQAQVATATKVYAGPSNPRTHEALYPGLMPGSEFAWAGLGPAAPLAGQPPLKAPYGPIFQWVFGLRWDWRTFDFDKDDQATQTKLAADLNANNPNLDTFRSHGHKLLLYHGWADPLVPPGETVAYYSKVLARGSKGTPVDASVRLFMLPGVAHCSGGPGPSAIDPLGAVVTWVETGMAPATLVASKTQTDGQGIKTTIKRPLCPYPAQPIYKGSGDRNDPAAYRCVVTPKGN